MNSGIMSAVIPQLPTRRFKT